MNGLISVVSVFVIGYVALAGALFFYQPNLLYFPDMPSRELEATPGDVGLDYEALTLATRDGEQLDAWFVPAETSRGVVLFCHGNAGNISHRLDSIRLFHELGLSVLIFDYRGYGQSSGKPTEQGTYRDADAAWDYLVEQRNIAGAHHPVWPFTWRLDRRRPGDSAERRRRDPGIRFYLGSRSRGDTLPLVTRPLAQSLPV